MGFNLGFKGLMMHLMTLYILVTTGPLVYVTQIVGNFLLATSSCSWANSLSCLHLMATEVVMPSVMMLGSLQSQWKCHCSTACLSASYMLNTDRTTRVVN